MKLGLKVGGLLAILAVGGVRAEGEAQPFSASLYARDGLVLHYDGIENAGAGVHSDSATKWVNLAGAADGAFDVTLPSWVTVGSNWMYSAVITGLNNGDPVSNSKTSAPSFPAAAVADITAATPVITLEVVVQRDQDWTYTDNYHNNQSPITTPRGHFAYRGKGKAETNDFNVIFPISATRTDMSFWRPNANAFEVHTLAAHLGVGANALWLDGSQSWTDWRREYESNWASVYKFFANTRVGLRIYAIRLYNRALSADEIACHAQLDRVRFLGAEPHESLRFVVKSVPAQTLDGAEDACPDPEVWDALENRRLVRGVDYRISYYENDRPGTGVYILNGLGRYTNRVRRTFPITHGFTATIADSGRGALGATVTFPAAGGVRALYAAWGETDGGILTNGWPRANFAKVADVPANATSVEVSLPDGATSAAALRFFLEHEATPRTYVTDGLRAYYDGVYNAGTFEAPTHDNASTNWLDLSGNGNSLWLPDYVTVQENALLSSVRIDPATGNKTSVKAGTFPQYSSMNGLAASPYEITLETVTRRADSWDFGDNWGNLQAVAYTPLGYVCYRQNDYKGYGLCYRGWNSGAGTYTSTYNTWFHSTADVRQPHTVAARLAQGLSNASFLMDGVPDAAATTKDYFQDGTAPSGYRFFLNLRAAVTAYAIRIYARRLSDVEMKRNAAVDAARFRGGNGRILAASALVRSGRLASRTSSSGIAVRLAAAPCARDLYVAWGTADCGSASNAWPNVAYVTRVPAGATQLDAVELPAAARRSHFGRIFLVDVYDSTSYVTNGLAGHWDGIDNVLVDGVRGHDAATRTWYDLTGRGADVALPSYVSVEANALYSVNHVGVSSASVSVTGVSSNSTVLTLESVARNCGWQTWDDMGNLQTPCSTPLGAIGFRSGSSNGFYCFTPARGNKRDVRNWLPEGENVNAVNTLAISLALDASELWINAARGDNQPYDWYSDTRPNVCSFFGAPRIGMRIYGVRIYTRLLSKEELAWNSGVDDVRYRGRPAPVRASDSFDFSATGSLFIIR